MATDSLEVKVHIGAELREIKNALRGLRDDLKRSGKTGREAGQETAKGFREAERQLKEMRRSARVAARQLKSTFAAIGGALLLKNITRTAVEFDKFAKGLRFAAGSAAAARKEMAFLRDVSNKLGLDLRAATKSYTQFASAAKGTAIEGEAAREVFVAVAEASTVMGLSAEETEGAMLALSQIISKGKVSAEELRQQLGERLPGAFQIAARAMNVLPAELDKMLASGQLASEVFLPRFAAELHKTFSPALGSAVTSAQAKINRFNTTIIDLQLAFANSGFLEGFTGALGELRDVLADPGMKAGLGALGKFIGESLKFIVENNRIILTVLAGLTAFSLVSKLNVIAGAFAGAGAALGTFLSLDGSSLEKLKDQLQGAGEAAGDAGITIKITKDSTQELALEAQKALAAFKDAKGILADYKDELANGVTVGSLTSAQAQALLATKARELTASLPVERMRELADALEAVGNDALAQKLRTALSEINATAKQGATGYLAGIRNALKSYRDEVADTATQAKDAMLRAFQGMEDALVDFVRTGKLQIRQFVDSVITDLARIVIRQQLIAPLLASLTQSAKGNAFSRGQLLAFASGGAFTNSLVTEPTLFPMGLMGEAGPEAILPLKRTKSGDLGVVAEGAGQTVVNVIEAPGQGGEVSRRREGDREIIDVLIDQFKTDLIRDVDRQGPFAVGLESRYGLSRTPGARR